MKHAWNSDMDKAFEFKCYFIMIIN